MYHLNNLNLELTTKHNSLKKLITEQIHSFNNIKYKFVDSNSVIITPFLTQEGNEIRMIYTVMWDAVPAEFISTFGAHKNSRFRKEANILIERYKPNYMNVKYDNNTGDIIVEFTKGTLINLSKETIIVKGGRVSWVA